MKKIGSNIKEIWWRTRYVQGLAKTGETPVKDFATILFQIDKWDKNLLSACVSYLKRKYGQGKWYMAACGRTKERIQLEFPGLFVYVKPDSGSYLRLLLTCGCVVTDGYLPDYYYKRQICIKIGVPKEKPVKNHMGRIQRTLLLSDYLLAENENQAEQTLEDYQIRPLFQGKILSLKKNLQEISLENHGEKIFIYPGGLGDNGITRSYLNLMETVDLNEKIYIACFREKYMKKIEALEQLPSQVKILQWAGDTPMTLLETFAYILKFKGKRRWKWLDRVIDAVYVRESKRRFQGMDISACVQFSGYEKEVIRIFQNFPGKRVIFVHANMVSEVKMKGNQDWDTLQKAYENYDQVAVITEGLMAPTKEISRGKGNFVVVPNCQNFRSVYLRGEKPIIFNEWTKSTVTSQRLCEILESQGEKFITIGRFSPEKGHDMLLHAFERYHREHPQSALILIGGEGPSYEETLELANTLSCKDCVAIIKSVENPMPILKQCDLFLLSSHFEGLPMTIFEADILGVPVVSTNIEGPRKFLLEHGGCLVEESEEGVYQGMELYHQGKVNRLNIDFEVYNQKAANAFLNCIQ